MNPETIKKGPKQRARSPKTSLPGLNDPCFCNSKKKAKRCCLPRLLDELAQQLQLPGFGHAPVVASVDLADPIWGDRWLKPPRGIGQSQETSGALARDGAGGAAHPAGGGVVASVDGVIPFPSGRRPTDHKRTWEMRAMYMEIRSALEQAEILSKMFKCAVEFGACDGCGKAHLNPVKCSSRLCPFESRRLAAERLGLYERLLTKAKSPRFLTLTRPLIPYTSDLRKGIAQLRDAWRRLLRRKVFAKVWAGVYSIEIVLRPGGFHVHMHLLIDAIWIENRNEKGRPLEEAWKACLVGAGVDFAEGEDIDHWLTSDGRRAKRSVVDIRPCDKGTLREVLKYTVKGATAKGKGGGKATSSRRRRESSVHTGGKVHIPEQISWGEVPFEGLKQLVEVVEGRVHLIQPFGDWHGELGVMRKSEREEGKKKAWERHFCTCGGEIIHMSTMPWGDPRLVFVAGSISIIPPPGRRIG